MTMLEKLSSYNLFNNLLPGVLFAALVDRLTSQRLVQDDIVVGLFLYYFLGVIVNRIGSLVLEPTLKKIGFLSPSPYCDFITASARDPKIEVLSETNNMYRTLASLMTCVIFVTTYDYLANKLRIETSFTNGLCLCGLTALFLLSYRKQTQYIKNRVIHHSK